MTLGIRDPGRIGPILQVLQKIWEKHDQQRFGQLVSNLIGKDSFYLEDDTLLRYLQAVDQNGFTMPKPGSKNIRLEFEGRELIVEVTDYLDDQMYAVDMSTRGIIRLPLADFELTWYVFVF